MVTYITCQVCSSIMALGGVPKPSLPKLKVIKSRKQILKFSFEPKNERKYFCISALADLKRGQIKKVV